jgi:hypothetical protein
MTFGIPKHVLPLDMETGELTVEAHHKWLDTIKIKGNEEVAADEKHCASQQVTPSFVVDDIIRSPGPMDIVTGRGSHGKASMGYLRFRRLLEVYRDNYDSVGRHSKMVVAHRVLTELRNSGCRFVKSTPRGFEECNEEEARGKISHAFRNMRRGGVAPKQTPRTKVTKTKRGV